MVSQNERDAAYADGYNDGFRQGKQSRAHAPKETCPHCAGSGFETDSVTTCEFCGGDGLVFERDAEEYGATTTTGEGGISWTALLAVLERLRSKNRNPDNEWYHGWNAALQCLINDINARSAATAAPQMDLEKCMAEPKSDTEPICINCGREIVMSEHGPPINDICWSHTHNGVVWCNWRTTAAPVEQKTFKNTKEAMLYAQRNNIPAVVPVGEASTSARALAEEIAKYIETSTPLSVGGAMVRTLENIINRHSQ